MLEHQNPLDPLPEGPDGIFAEGPDLRAKSLTGAGFLLLQSTSELILQYALASEIGLPLPAPLSASVKGDYALLWLSPAEWLLEHPAHESASLQSSLTHRVARPLAVTTDMSDAFACFEVSGAGAAEALEGGCSLDLSARVFPAGRVACTALADIRAIIWNPGGEPQRLRCIVDRSFARHLRDWLLHVVQDPAIQPTQ